MEFWQSIAFTETDQLIEIAKIAEEVGFAGLNMAEHLVTPETITSKYPYSPDGTARWELVTGGDDGHHHHLVCTVCSMIIEIDDCLPPGFERALADRHGFRSITHKLEFFGVCARCDTRAREALAAEPKSPA